MPTTPQPEITHPVGAMFAVVHRRFSRCHIWHEPTFGTPQDIKKMDLRYSRLVDKNNKCIGNLNDVHYVSDKVPATLYYLGLKAATLGVDYVCLIQPRLKKNRLVVWPQGVSTYISHASWFTNPPNGIEHFVDIPWLGLVQAALGPHNNAYDQNWVYTVQKANYTRRSQTATL